MNKHFQPEDVDQWTWRLVAAATARAIYVMRAVPTRIGPAGYRAHWPEIADEEGGSSDEEPKFRPTRDDITKAEAVLLGYEDEDGHKHPGWLQGSLLAYEDLRTTFARWAEWAARGKRRYDGLPETEEEFARRIGMSESSLRRARERAGAIIAANLNAAGLKPWYVEKPKRKNRHREGAAA